MTAFLRLALPMSVPAIAALAIFQFLFVWNDLLVALVHLGATTPDNLPMTVVLANLVNSTGGGWELIAPAAFISMALPLVVFFSLQRSFGRGITGVAVKGWSFGQTPATSDGPEPPPGPSVVARPCVVPAQDHRQVSAAAT